MADTRSVQSASSIPIRSRQTCVSDFAARTSEGSRACPINSRYGYFPLPPMPSQTSIMCAYSLHNHWWNARDGVTILFRHRRTALLIALGVLLLTASVDSQAQQAGESVIVELPVDGDVMQLAEK